MHNEVLKDSIIVSLTENNVPDIRKPVTYLEVWGIAVTLVLLLHGKYGVI